MMKSYLFLVVLLFSSTSAFAVMREYTEKFNGPADSASIKTERESFQKSVANALENPVLQKARIEAYRERFSSAPGEKYAAPCDLKKKYPGGLPKLTLGYEAHNDEQSNLYKAELFRRANRGEILFLTESDMSAQRDNASNKILNAGIARSMRLGGVHEAPKTSYIGGLDDEVARAAGALDSQTLEHVTNGETLAEVFRNPTLRNILASLDSNEIHELGKHDAFFNPPKKEREKLSRKLLSRKTQLQSILNQIDRDPGFDVSKSAFDIKRDGLALALKVQLTRQAPKTTSLCEKVSGLLCIELRDESISRAIVERLCHQTPITNEVHIAVGAYHVEGIRTRLKAVFGDQKYRIEEKNMMAGPEKVADRATPVAR